MPNNIFLPLSLNLLPLTLQESPKIFHSFPQVTFPKIYELTVLNKKQIRLRYLSNTIKDQK